MTIRRFLQLAAWSLFALILLATLSPIGLRPDTITTVNLDRALAYAAVAGAFVLAYPRHWKLAAMLLLCGAGVMEAMQFLSPTRHPELADAAVKTGGAAFGIVCGWGVNRAADRQTD